MIAPLRQKKDPPMSKYKKQADLAKLYEELCKTRKPLTFLDHIHFNTSIKIPLSINTETIDLSPQSHPQWNGSEIKFESPNKKESIEEKGKIVEKSVEL